MIVVAAKAPKHQDSKFVFRTWINETGWNNNVCIILILICKQAWPVASPRANSALNQVLCFITGLVNPLYAISGLDGITV